MKARKLVPLLLGVGASFLVGAMALTQLDPDPHHVADRDRSKRLEHVHEGHPFLWFARVALLASICFAIGIWRALVPGSVAPSRW
jgi:hypothetical protein